ncbi:negative regulator of the H(+)-ATPase Pma1p [Saccharomyces cerevisiae]|nr:negative regulator of the H(+)-ATPase Pma1p [Saccharomyces cerevisiae]
MNDTLSSFLNRNEALGLNPPHGLDMHITKRGSDCSCILITFFEFFAFFTYASDLGWTGVQAEFNHVKVSKSITGEVPLAASTTGENDDISALDMVHSLLIQIVGTLFWVVSLLVGSLIKSTYKWGYYTIGAVAMLVTQGVICQRQFFNLKTRGFNALMLLPAW